MSAGTVSLDTVRAAAARIEGYVRRTPVLAAAPVKAPLALDGRLTLKLECLQIVGSFKARGAAAKLTSLDAAAVRHGLVTASGGNHGLGVAYAGWRAGVPTRVYLPLSTPETKARQIAGWGAEVVYEGQVWDEANRAALAAAEAEGLSYVHAFADAEVISGQGTVGLEMLEDVPDADLIVVAVGGGGLISGIATAVKALKPRVRIVGVEALGAPTLHASLAAGQLVTLDKIETAAGTLAPRRSAEINFEIVRRLVDEVVLVSDDEMRHAARWLWSEFAVATELSGAATIAALMTGACRPPAGAHVVALICGAGSDGFG
jgi:threonine dehydratase